MKVSTDLMFRNIRSLRSGIRAFFADRVNRPIKVGLILATRFDEGYNNSFSPLGLGYLAASVRESLPNVTIVMKERIDDLIQEKPELIGISAQSEHYSIAIGYANKIKNILNIPVIIGGVHISMLPESFDDNFDVAVIGDGESTFVELLRSFLDNNGFRINALMNIRGLLFKVAGFLKMTPPREAVKNLDLLPKPIYEELPFYNKSPVACIVTSRGCPYHCTFCISEKFSKFYRHLSSESVSNDIEELVRAKGVKHIVFYDDLLVADTKRLASLLYSLRKKKILGEVSFSCAVRANLVNHEVVYFLKELNVVDLGMGIESFSDKILRYYNKTGITGEVNQRALDLLYEAGLTVNPSFIFAAPIETKEDMLMTLRKIFINFKEGKLGSPTWATLIPYPGTKIWDYAAEKGIVSNNMDWNNYQATQSTMYLCEEVSLSEFNQLMDEWVTKFSLLLKNIPERGGHFVVRNDAELQDKIKYLFPILNKREEKEMGDDLILQEGNRASGVLPVGER
jgi:anaerobic magnesium-protoporphyrin IX monomethyl ester cyclase